MTRAPGVPMLIPVLIAVLAAATGIGAQDRAAPASPYVLDAMAQVRRAVEPQAGQAHLGRMFALRRLRDPALAPIYQRLLDDGDWPMQVHGVLGLAELESPPRLDPLRLAQVAPEAQEPLIANAIDMALVDADGLEAMLGTDGLEPFSRLLITAELILAGRSPDAAPVRALAAHADDRVALLARLLLRSLDASEIPALDERLEPMPRRDRRAMTMWLLEAIRQYQLRASLPFAHAMLQSPRLDPMTRYQALLTVLRLDPEGGLSRLVSVWDDLSRETPPRYAERVRFALLLLAADDTSRRDAIARAWDQLMVDLPDSDALIPAMRAVALSPSPSHSSAERADAYLQLLDLAHPATTEWVMSELELGDGAVAVTVYGALIDRGPSRAGAAARVALAVEAARRLFRLDAVGVLDRLAAAPDDSEAQEILLLSLLDQEDARIAGVVRAVPRRSAGRADSLAVVLLARHSTALSDDDRTRLGIIASGGGLVSSGLQTQAAWLFLGQEGAQDEALQALRAVDTSP